MNSHSKIHTCKSSFSDFRSFMIATLLANDVFASSASASKLFLVANSVAMSVCSCFTIPCSQEVIRKESRIAYEIPILVGVLEFSLLLAKKKFQESHDVQRVKHTMW